MKIGKRVVAAAAACIMSLSSMALFAYAEETAHYIEGSDFSDCAMGGAENPIYGTGIALDGNPWLTKGSAQRHYQTFLHDDERDVNYVRMYSNSDKSGSNDGAGSMYMYQRVTGSDFTKYYGMCEFDVRLRAGTWELNFGDFTDPTKGYDNLAGAVVFDNAEIIKAKTLNGEKEICRVEPNTWYRVRVTVNNRLQEFAVGVYDMSGKQIGLGEELIYTNANTEGIRTWCFSYVRGSKYYYDLTNVTIAKNTDTAFEMK